MVLRSPVSMETNNGGLPRPNRQASDTNFVVRKSLLLKKAKVGPESGVELGKGAGGKLPGIVRVAQDGENSRA